MKPFITFVFLLACTLFGAVGKVHASGHKHVVGAFGQLHLSQQNPETAAQDFLDKKAVYCETNELPCVEEDDEQDEASKHLCLPRCCVVFYSFLLTDHFRVLTDHLSTYDQLHQFTSCRYIEQGVLRI